MNLASSGRLTVGQAAQRSGISAKMIRHYESLGLLPPALRTESGYRLYSDKDIHVLQFIRHSRDLGFSLKDIESLLSLWKDQNRSSAQVKQLAAQHLAVLQQKIEELTRIQSELELLVQDCKGNNRPDCPILNRLADQHPSR